MKKIDLTCQKNLAENIKYVKMSTNIHHCPI